MREATAMRGGEVPKDEIFARLRETLVAAFELAEDQVVPDARLVADLELDSLDLVDLVVRLEQDTNLEIDEEELKSISTVQDVVDLLHRKLGTPAT
jgi:acyl carrier protein